MAAMTCGAITLALDVAGFQAGIATSGARYRFAWSWAWVCPAVHGEGKRLFETGTDAGLALVDCTTFSSGTAILSCRPEQQPPA